MVPEQQKNIGWELSCGTFQPCYGFAAVKAQQKKLVKYGESDLSK